MCPYPSFLQAEVPKHLAKTLSSLFAAHISHVSELHVMPFSQKYRLAFTLLNEDATGGQSPMSWDVEDAIARTFTFVDLKR